MVETYLVVKWLHVTAAAVLVGMLAADALLVRHLKTSSSEVRRSAWRFLHGGEKVAGPTGAVLLLTGLGMVYGPAAGGWTFKNDVWTGGGLVIWLVVTILMAGIAGGAAKKLAADPDGPHRDGLERRFTMAVGASSVLVVGVLWLMVVKPF